MNIAASSISGAARSADGAIRASVGNSDVYKASGRFADSGREVTMIYPDCPDGIAMRIVNKIPD